jgi:hypothetical protein
MKKMQLIALLLVVLLSVFSLAACGGGDGSGQISEKQSDKDVFLSGLSASILDFSDLTATLTSMQLDILLNPDNNFSADQSSSTQFDITLASGEDSIALKQALLYDAASGDAARTVDINMGAEAAGSSGVYFIGNQMLVKPSDTSKPMVRHTIADASGMKTASVGERIDMVFSENYVKLTEAGWQDAAAAYADSISFVADEAFTQQEIAVDLAEVSQTVKAYTLTAAGPDAYTVFAGFVDMLAQDAAFAAYAQGAQSKLATLDQAAKDAMSLVFTVNIFDAEAIGFDVTASCADGSQFTLKAVNYRDGHARQTELHLASFDGVILDVTAVFGQVVDNAQNCNVNYHLSDPRSYAINETLSVSGSGVIDEGQSVAYTLNMNYSMSTTQDGSNVSYQITSPLQYTSSNTDSGSDSVINMIGLTMTVNGEASDPVNATINVFQAFEDVTISAPEFIAGSGIETATTADLVNALGADFTTTEYRSMPQTLRMIYSMVAL